MSVFCLQNKSENVSGERKNDKQNRSEYNIFTLFSRALTFHSLQLTTRQKLSILIWQTILINFNALTRSTRPPAQLALPLSLSYSLAVWIEIEQMMEMIFNWIAIQFGNISNLCKCLKMQLHIQKWMRIHGWKMQRMNVEIVFNCTIQVQVKDYADSVIRPTIRTLIEMAFGLSSILFDVVEMLSTLYGRITSALHQWI